MGSEIMRRMYGSGRERRKGSGWKKWKKEEWGDDAVEGGWERIRESGGNR